MIAKLESELDLQALPSFKKLEPAPIHTTSKSTISTKLSVLQDCPPGEVLVGFEDLSNQDMLMLDELSGSKSQFLTVKQVLAEFDKRQAQLKEEDEDFLKLLQMPNDGDEDMTPDKSATVQGSKSVNDEDIKDAMEDIEMPAMSIGKLFVIK
jgi:hypothetical protein